MDDLRRSRSRVAAVVSSFIPSFNIHRLFLAKVEGSGGRDQERPVHERA